MSSIVVLPPAPGRSASSALRSVSSAVLVALVMLAAVSATVLVRPGAAGAHSDFVSSEPADGAVVDAPVEVVTLTFTGTPQAAGEGIVALTAAGALQEPSDVVVDRGVFTLRFDPPLAGGATGVRWTVQSGDLHPIEGSFAFTVDAPVPTTIPPTTAAPTIAAPAGTVPATTVVAPPPTAAEVAGPATTAVATTTTVVDGGSEAVALGETSADPPPGPAAAPSLDEFLAVDGSVPGQGTATVGRVVGFLGVALGLGAFGFLGTALRGRRSEVRRVVSGVRLLGLVVALGAAIEYVGVARIAGESIASGWSTTHGFATVMRVVGGLGLAVGVAGQITQGRVQRPLRRPSTVRSLSAAVVEDLGGEHTAAPDDRFEDGPVVGWSPTSRSWPALAGATLIVVSFWFDGHTVSRGVRPLHAVVNSVHVLAGSTWVGGLVAMTAVVWSRHRSGRPMRVVELVVRFSRVATISLAAVVVAGLLLAVFVLDSFGDLTGTPWGRILLLKTAAVAIAASIGAYNHLRLLPALEADPESPELATTLRSTITSEAILLGFVVVVTAWLVAAAS